MDEMRWASRWGTCALSVSVAITSVAPRAKAQEPVCVAEAIEQELARCPEGASARAPSEPGSSAVPGASTSAARSAPRDTPAPGVTTSTVRNPHAALEVRSRELLGRERTILERIVARQPPRDPRRADAMWRLADVLGELSREAEVRARSLDEPIFRARQPRGQGLEALLARQRAAEAEGGAVREDAVRVLAELVRDHPSFARSDEALYTLAYHLERMGQRARARQAYQRLIRSWPASRFVPHAYLAYAEHAFEEGQLDDARQLYERVLTYPAEQNPVYAYARYKLAWVHYNAERFRDSLEAMVGVIEHVRAHPETPDGASLARQARREIVMPYARVGSPPRALAFFRRVGDGEDDAIGMLERLGELYFDAGSWPETIAVHHALMAERPQHASLCAWQGRVLDATISSRPKDEQVREARRLVRVRELARSAPEEARRACDEQTATSLIVLATSWHREAVGTDDQPGTRDRATMSRAAELYQLIEEHVPSVEALTLSAIDARDRPSRAQLAYFHGELLFDMQRWDQCASAYERALDASPEPQLAADAAYGAVVCYDRHLGTRTPPQTPRSGARDGQPTTAEARSAGAGVGCRHERSDQCNDRALAERPLTEEERRMTRTFARFACTAPRHEELPVVLYRWARIHYEANQFERAAVLFSRVATQHARSEVGVYAANLWLDSLNVLAESRQRASCDATFEAALAPIERGFCADEPARQANRSVCEIADGARCTLGARRAVQLGQGGHHREAANLYLELARTQSCPEEDVYLYNAAMELETIRLIGRAIRVRTVLIEAHPASRLVPRAIHHVGANYHALAMYGQAADFYERFAREHADAPCEGEDCPDAAEGLRNAVLFRMGLGEREAAIEDARLFERRFGRRDARRTSEVVFAIGTLYEQAGQWTEVIAHYRRFLRTYGQAASRDRVARAHMMIGRGYVEAGDRGRAREHLEAAVRAHAEGGEEALAGDEHAIALLRDAASEARFELAEAARERFEAIAFPSLRGRPSLESVSRWAAGELAPWMEAKRAAFLVAEEAYGHVHPLGIPRWRIASASRIGDMIDGMVERVRSSPVPAIIEADPELLAAYWEELDDVTEPYLALAVRRYEHCLETATSTRWFDERSRRCEEALHRLDAVRYPMASELRGHPDYEPRHGEPPTAPSLEAAQDG